jgi:hypothetical protein
MSATNPPDPNVNTFNNLYWISGDTSLTQDVADKRYLRFPTAQGTENLAAINVAGIAGFNNEIVQTGATNNIIQDLTLVGDQNLLKATDIYGDLNLRRPTAGLANGGALRLWDITNNTSGNSVQIYNNGTTMSLVNLNNGGATTFTTNDGGGASLTPLSLSNASVILGVPTLPYKPITMSSLSAADRSIDNVYYQLRDANNLATTTGQIYAGTGVFNYDNDANGGTHNFATNDGAGVQTIPLSFNSVDMSIATTNPPTCSAVQPVASDSSTKIPTTAWTQGAIDAKIPTSLLGLNNTWTGTNDFVNLGTGSLTSSAVQPVASDSSTKVPTTAWVQTAIAAAPAPVLQTNTAEHYSTANNNTYPFGTNPATIPLINFADVDTYASTYGVQFWDAVVFDFVFNLTISGVNTNFTDAGGVGINNSQVSGTMYVYPTAFTTTTALSFPYFYLNGGIGSSGSGSSTYYSCPVTAYTPNGRPFWVNGLLNGANAMVCMPCNTIRNSTNAQLVFYFAPINWNNTTQCNWSLSITLRNSGKIPVSKITTQNFNINNI